MFHPVLQVLRRYPSPGRHKLIDFFLIILCVTILSTPTAVTAAEVTLAWNANTEPRVAGYRVYYGTGSYYYTNVVDAGNSTQAVVSGLLNGVRYYFAVTAYDSTGGESYFSNEVSYTVPAGSNGGGGAGSDTGGSGGGCFIATAAYGSALSPEVSVLRQFRDNYLLTNTAGRAFVKLYYALSPPIADVIRESESLKALTRSALAPVVLAVKHPGGFAAALTFLEAGLIVFRRKLARTARTE